jgi:hypothetical protein
MKVFLPYLPTVHQFHFLLFFIDVNVQCKIKLLVVRVRIRMHLLLSAMMLTHL